MSTKRLSAEERKKQILLAAIKVFAERTYHGATTKRIAEEAGITEALIYRYFGSKRALFTEAIDHTSGRLVRGLEATLQEYRDRPLQAITECFSFYANILENHQHLAKMIFLVISELDDPDIREVYLPYQERALKALAESMMYWRGQGYLKNPDTNVKTASWLFYGTYLILALVKHSHGNIAIDASFAVEMAKPYFSEKAIQDD